MTIDLLSADFDFKFRCTLILSVLGPFSLVNTVGGFLSLYIDGYANDPLEIKLVVCGDNFEIKDMRTPFSVIHDFGSVLCVYECVFLLILGMRKGNYIGISSRNKLN